MQNKLFLGAISHDASNQPEAYLGPSQKSLRGSMFAEIVNGCKPLTAISL